MIILQLKKRAISKLTYNDINKNSKDNRTETKCYKNIRNLNMTKLLNIKKLINNKRNS